MIEVINNMHMDQTNNPNETKEANDQPPPVPAIKANPWGLSLNSLSPESTEARLKFFAKFDWRIVLPLGAAILIYVSQYGHYPSFLRYIGELCFTVGVVNLGAKFFLKK